MALGVGPQSTYAVNINDLIAAKTFSPGEWLFAIAAVRVTDGSTPALYVGDAARNIWQLLYSGTTVADATHAGAQMHVQVWACPAARMDGWVDQLRVTGATMSVLAHDTGSAVWNVFTGTGFANGHLTVDSVTLGTASATTSFSVISPAPSGAANCMHIGAVCVDDDTATVTATGAGFGALTQVSMTTPGLKISGQWKAATTGQTASWTSGSAVNWAGVIVAVRETGVGPAAPSPNWPIPKFEVGLGHDMSTPISAVRWTDQTSRLVETEGTPVLSSNPGRGIPYELGEAQSSLTDLAIRNDDGAYTPRTVNTAASANAAGTTTTVKIADAVAVNINKADFFQLKTAGLVLKELTVFQVTGLSSAAGTTTVTFARADGVAGGAQSSTASGDVYAGIGIDLNIPWRYSMYQGGKWWPVASGWFGQLPQAWRDAWWGTVNASGVDGLATLTAANPSALAGEILRRAPVAYWPLSDSSSSGQAQDVSGNNAPALVQKSSKFGTGANGNADFGTSTQQVDNGIATPSASKSTLIGDAGSGWAQTGFTAAELNTNQGFALVGSGLNIDITNGITIMGFTMMTATDLDLIGGTGTTFDQTLMIVRNTDPAAGVGQGAVLKLSVEHTIGADYLKPKITVWDQSTHAFTTTYAGTFQIVAVDFKQWAVAFDRTGWTFLGGSVAVSGSANLVDTINLIDVAGESDRFFTGRMMNCLHCHVAIFPRKLTLGEATSIRFAGVYGTPQLNAETVSARVARKLNTVGWRGPRVIHETDIIASAEGEDSGTVAELAQNLSNYEDGLMCLDALGQLQWRGHIPGYYQASKVTFGERADLGEIPYQAGQSYGFDNTFIYNDVEVTNQRVVGFSVASSTITAATDPVSAAKYTQRSLARSTRLYSAADTYGLAWSLLNRYKQPELRVSQIVVDCASNPAAWETCLGLETGDLATVTRRPLNAPPITQLYRVLQVSPEIGPDIGRFTFTFAAADDPVIVLGAGAKAIIGTGTIGW